MAALHRAEGIPNQRVVADGAEKKKGVTENSVTPFSDLVPAAELEPAT